MERVDGHIGNYQDIDCMVRNFEIRKNRKARRRIGSYQMSTNRLANFVDHGSFEVEGVVFVCFRISVLATKDER